MSQAPRPPLPPTEAELEALMTAHLEAVTPAAPVRARTLSALRARAAATPERRPPGTWSWPALIGLALLASGGWLALPGLGSSSPGEAEQAGLPAPTPRSEPAEALDPSPPEPRIEASSPEHASPEPTPREWLLPLLPGEPGPEADYDYNRLQELLPAELILLGTVEGVRPDGGASLRVRDVIKGDATELERVSTSGDFNGCEGIPSFQGLEGVEVIVFLERRADGTLGIVHGSAGLQRAPYKDKLDGAALRQLGTPAGLDAATLAALIQAQGPSLLPWLWRELGNLGTPLSSAAPEVQAALAGALDRLEELKRNDVLGVVAALHVDALTPEQLAALQRYHDSFRSKLGEWVRAEGDSYWNRPEDHVTFLRFLAPHAEQWVLEQVELTLRELEAGTHPRVRPQVYEQFLESLSE